MAMATSTQLSSSPFFHSQITRKPFFLPAATISSHEFSTRRRKSLSLSRRPSLSAFAASSAVDVNEPVISDKSTRTLPFRVGHGFDLHRLEPGYPLIIGGIDIPHDRGCEAHSDGDVLLHCVVDAILGALGLPDIGQIFPDSDPKWKGAASSVFIKEAVRSLEAQGLPSKQAEGKTGAITEVLSDSLEVVSQLVISKGEMQKEDGTDDQKKGSQLLEVYAIEIECLVIPSRTQRLVFGLCQRN